jgi:hypothetical protein
VVNQIRAAWIAYNLSEVESNGLLAEVASPGKIFAQQTVGVFIRAALARTNTGRRNTRRKRSSGRSVMAGKLL